LYHAVGKHLSPDLRLAVTIEHVRLADAERGADPGAVPARPQGRDAAPGARPAKNGEGRTLFLTAELRT